MSLLPQELWNYIFTFISNEDESLFLTSLPKSMLMKWFEFMTKQCNKEQKEILYNIIFTKKQMMILGEPGTGKTYLLKLANKMLNKLQVLTQVCAFTGLAGQQADGATLHRIFPLFKFKNNWNKDLGYPTHNEIGNNFIPFNGILFIDEISMVSPVLFEQIMYFQKNASTDKFRIIVFGDFWQLPPIESSLNDYKRKFFFQNYHMYKIEIFELTIPQRHCDLIFLSLIRSIRKNDYNENVMQFLKERKLAFDFLNQTNKKNKLYLFHDNKRVDAHNIQFLNLIQLPIFHIPFQVLSIYAQTSYYCGATKIMKTKQLSSYIGNNNQAFLDIPELQSILIDQQVKDIGLKIGCQIMFNKNIYNLINCNTPEECQFYKKCIHHKLPCIDIFNGTRGKIVKIWPNIGLLVELQEKSNLFFPLIEYSIEISTRRKVGFKIGTHVLITKGLMKSGFGKILEINENDIKIELKKQEFIIPIESLKPIPRIKKTIASVLYYPIVLSYALTIQKSQGMTLDSIVLSLSYIPSPYLVTVAISRCRTLEGVFINGEFKKPQGEIDPLIIEFTKQLSLNNNKKFIRKISNITNFDSLILNFQIKVVTKNNQFIVYSNIITCPFFTTSKNLAIRYIHDICTDYISKNCPELLELCSLKNIVSLLAQKKQSLI